MRKLLTHERKKLTEKAHLFYKLIKNTHTKTRQKLSVFKISWQHVRKKKLKENQYTFAQYPQTAFKKRRKSFYFFFQFFI